MTQHPVRGRNQLNHHGFCQCVKCQPPTNTQEPQLLTKVIFTGRAKIEAEAIEQDITGGWRVHWRAFPYEGEEFKLNEQPFGSSPVHVWNAEVEKWKSA